MGLHIRDQLKLFILNLLDEDPEILSLCTLDEITSIFAQETGCELNDKVCSNLQKCICSFLCDIMNQEEQTAPMNGTLNNNHDQLMCKNAPLKPVINNSCRRSVMLSHTEVLTLAAASTIGKSDSFLTTRSMDGESISKRIKLLRETPLLGMKSLSKLSLNKPITGNYSSDKNFSLKSNLSVTINSDSDQSKEEGIRKISLLNSESIINSPTISSSPNVQSGALKRLVSVPLCSVLPANSVKNANWTMASSQQASRMHSPVSTTKPNVTIKRQLSEAVISIRPATSRLSEDD